MAATVTENRTFDKNMQKLYEKKNPVKCQLLPNIAESGVKTPKINLILG
jgi:hypothetical protein